MIIVLQEIIPDLVQNINVLVRTMLELLLLLAINELLSKSQLKIYTYS